MARETCGPRRLEFVMNIPSPYRIDLFNRMHELAAARDIQLAVHFMAVTEQGRFWKPDPNTWRFEGRIWPGFRPVVGGVDCHFNPSLLKHLVRHAPDWLVVGGWIHPTLALILAGRWLLPRETTLMSWLEANPFAARHNTGPVAAIRRWLLNACDAFIVPGEMAQQTISHVWHLSPRPFVQLPNLIDTSFYGNHVVGLRNQRAALRTEMGIGLDALVLFWSARLHEPTKGVRRFLDLCTRVPDLKAVVLLVGDGPDRKEVEAAAAAHPTLEVRVMGHVSRDETGRCMAVADASILPSLRDPNPLTAIESIWAGLPLLTSTHCGNWRETVEDGRNGWVIDPEDSLDVIRGITALAHSRPEELAAMGARSREKAATNFDTDTMLNRFLDGLQAVKKDG